MDPFVAKLQELLAERFGVQPEFTAQLAPLLERISHEALGADEWEGLLACVANAYRLRDQQKGTSLGETRVLMREFDAELQKVGESLKVLGVFLDRLRETAVRPDRARPLH